MRVQMNGREPETRKRVGEREGEWQRGVSFWTTSILHGRLARSKQAILPIDFSSRGVAKWLIKSDANFGRIICTRFYFVLILIWDLTNA